MSIIISEDLVESINKDIFTEFKTFIEDGVPSILDTANMLKQNFEDSILSNGTLDIETLDEDAENIKLALERASFFDRALTDISYDLKKGLVSMDALCTSLTGPFISQDTVEDVSRTRVISVFTDCVMAISRCLNGVDSSVKELNDIFTSKTDEEVDIHFKDTLQMINIISACQHIARCIESAIYISIKAIQNLYIALHKNINLFIKKEKNVYSSYM